MGWRSLHALVRRHRLPGHRFRRAPGDAPPHRNRGRHEHHRTPRYSDQFAVSTERRICSATTSISVIRSGCGRRISGSRNRCRLGPAIRGEAFGRRAPAIVACRPADRFHEQVWQHEMAPDAEGRVSVALVNDSAWPRFELDVAKSEFPCMYEWQNFQSGHYALGLEPANHHVRALPSPASARRKSSSSMATASYRSRFRILSGTAALAETRARMRGCGNPAGRRLSAPPTIIFHYGDAMTDPTTGNRRFPATGHDRPHHAHRPEKLNAISLEMARRLETIVAECNRDPDIRRSY